MGDYNLAGLDPRNFEHLTQALAAKDIARGVTPFGDGPDGGREATYRGRMDYPSMAEPWDGYLVIQCKFRQRSRANPADEAKWAVEQLKEDLEKFTDPGRALPKPEYYLFVTNVNLTPAPVTGSKDKVLSLLGSYRDVLGLKGYDVWDFDKLCRLLDTHPEVRQTYAAFVTPGDVLAAMKDRMPDLAPDFWHVMPIFLQRELEADQYARLQQLDESFDKPISLANVFVDLPALDRYTPEPPEDEHDPDQLPSGLVAEILQAGSIPLRGSSFVATKPDASQSKVPSNPELGRYVVVGGPGQGKSTIGQFVCQLYRAAILSERPPHTLRREAQDVINLLARECSSTGTELPTARRFPVRVVLDQFATCLAKQQCTSLLTYIVGRINAPDRMCSAEDLRKWLGRYSWVLVLDGLDEVPVTSNRAQVLEQIAEFWREAKALDADVLVVATTRPQGYSDEFSPDLYQHRYLAPLSPARALSYATRLVEARYGSDPEQKHRAMTRLKQACEQDTTARLMRSPLQVTIMAALVDRVGQAPQERWELFQRYYDVFYNRECEKETGASQTLRERRRDIHAIHRRVGLLLQTESERAGGTESRLPVGRFVQLVRSHLDEEGYEDQELEQRTQEIIDAAVTRLVFLVRVGDNLGFEIRSLQEFMAAEALMEGSDETVRERLHAIAPSSHWRNVFLFAAGKCFADRTSLRDTVYSICDQLNDSTTDRLAGTSHAGSRLALDILLEGVARQQPRFARQFARLACELMSLPIPSENSSLATAYDSTLDAVFQEKIRERIGRPEIGERFGAWSVLRVLLDRRVPWALELATANWPIEAESQYNILALPGGTIPHIWILEKLAEVIGTITPARAVDLLWHIGVPPEVRDDLPAWLPTAERILRRDHYFRSLVAGFQIDPHERDRVVLVRVEPTGSISDSMSLDKLPPLIPEWAPLVAAARFAADPTPATLARELSHLGEAGAFDEASRSTFMSSRLAERIPWPIAACIDACTTREECAALARRVERGELGAYEDWLVAESRWQEGVGEDDWEYATDDHWPFDNRIAKVGFPLGVARLASFVARNQWNALQTWYFRLPGAKARSRAAILLTEALLSWTFQAGEKVSIAATQLHDIIAADPRKEFQFGLLRVVRLPKRLTSEWIRLFEMLGSTKTLIYTTDWSGSSHPAAYPAEALARAYRRDRQRSMLLAPLAVMGISGSSTFRLPAELLDPERHQAQNERLLSLYIQLAQGSWAADDATRLAALLFENASDEDVTVDLTLSALRNGLLSGRLKASDVEEIILAIHGALLTRSSLATGRTFEHIKTQLAQRVSPLQDPDRWRELALPPAPIGEPIVTQPGFYSPRAIRNVALR